jgi:hypothetical protein
MIFTIRKFIDYVIERLKKSNQDQLENREKLKSLLLFQLS